MDKKELLYILDFVFEHYIESDLDDDQREHVETGYEQIKNIIEKGLKND